MNINEEHWTFSNNCNKHDFLNFYAFFIPFANFDAVFTVVLMRMKSILCMSFYLHWGLLKLDFYISIVCSIALMSTHEYFCEVLRTYSTTFIKWVLSTYSSTDPQYSLHACSRLPFWAPISISEPYSPTQDKSYQLAQSQVNRFFQFQCHFRG